MVKTFVALGLAAVSSGMVAADDFFTGIGTTYTLSAPDQGNCNMLGGHPSNEMDMYAALNAAQWNLEECGRCAAVSCADSKCTPSQQNTTHIVHILDSCPDCTHGGQQLDMSPAAYKAITGTPNNNYQIKWKWADCPFVQGGVEYCLKAGSHQWWGAVQIANSLKKVASVTINGLPAKLMGGAYYYVIDNGGKTIDYSSVKISVTSVTGETITDTVALKDGGCVKGSHQFVGGSTQPQPTTSMPVTTKVPVPTTTVPVTTAPATTTPATAAPVSTAPATTAPATTAPATTSPVTSAPVTTAPATADPVTVAPVTTVPTTTSPSTSAPETTAPPTSAPTSKPKACKDKKKKSVRRH